MTVKGYECYGAWGSRESCRLCRYRASCRYYTNNPLNDRRKGCESVDFEEVSGWLEETADYSDIPGEHESDGKEELIGVEKLAIFFRYLLNLDRYTLALLKQLFSDKNDNGEIPSVTELAEKRGCSRQAVHRKILDIIRKNPELSGLFSLTLRRLPRESRKRYAGA